MHRSLLLLLLSLGSVPVVVREGTRGVRGSGGPTRSSRPPGIPADETRRVELVDPEVSSVRATEAAAGRAPSLVVRVEPMSTRSTVPVRHAPVAPPDALPRFDVRGIVVDELGQPLCAELTAVFAGRPARRVHGSSRSDGSFVLGGLEGGSWKIHVVGDDRYPAEEAVSVNRYMPRLRLVLQSPWEIRGVVVGPYGEPVAGAEVGEGGLSDELGHFSIRSTTRSLGLFASLAGYAPSRSIRLAPEPGSKTEGIELRLRPACEISGSVPGWDPRGESTSRVQVIDAHGRTLTAEPDAWGGFAVNDLPPGMTAVICKDGQGTEWRARLRLRPGQPRVVALRPE